eukprot:16446968-Heterocapsa_arctica.AAC.1
MKVLYAARLACFDLLKAVANQAKHITKWDKGCDIMLHILMCYINSSLDLSTPEAEIVAANAAVRSEGLPALQLWETVLKSGKNHTMRHLNKTHRVNLAWLSEVFRKCDQ